MTGGPGESPLPAFLELRGRLRERLEAADGLDLGRVRVRSPFIPLLSVDLGSAFALVAVHERRHLWQARQVLERFLHRPDPPDGPAMRIEDRPMASIAAEQTDGIV